MIPSNDDASKSIDKILTLVTAAITEGLSDRGSDKDAEAAEKTAPAVATATEEVAPAAEAAAPATEE